MLDSLVKYERDKNFVRYNYNGQKLFIGKELVMFLMVTTILLVGVPHRYSGNYPVL